LGEFNNSDIDLFGNNNVVSTCQSEDLNIVNSTVFGSSNVVGIKQAGDLNNASVWQKGNYNFAKIIQGF